MWQELSKGNAAEETLFPGQLSPLIQLCAASLHDAAEVHSAWAYALSVATYQTQREVLAVCSAGLDSARVQSLHQVNSSAW